MHVIDTPYIHTHTHTHNGKGDSNLHYFLLRFFAFFFFLTDFLDFWRSGMLTLAFGGASWIGTLLH